jgi:hypothetical protein
MECRVITTVPRALVGEVKLPLAVTETPPGPACVSTEKELPVMGRLNVTFVLDLTEQP